MENCWEILIGHTYLESMVEVGDFLNILYLFFVCFYVVKHAVIIDVF